MTRRGALDTVFQKPSSGVGTPCSVWKAIRINSNLALYVTCLPLVLSVWARPLLRAVPPEREPEHVRPGLRRGGGGAVQL